MDRVCRVSAKDEQGFKRNHHSLNLPNAYKYILFIPFKEEVNNSIILHAIHTRKNKSTITFFAYFINSCAAFLLDCRLFSWTKNSKILGVKNARNVEIRTRSRGPKAKGAIFSYLIYGQIEKDFKFPVHDPSIKHIVNCVKLTYSRDPLMGLSPN